MTPTPLQPTWQSPCGRATLYKGDSLAIMPELPESSADAVVCDPPYEIGFMGATWDKAGVAFRPETWKAALRVAKPGAYLLAFGGTRTFHRLAVAIEDAGWELRDTIMWVYGSGFPKSHDVSKAIDKAAGAEREVVGQVSNHRNRPATNKWKKSALQVKGRPMPGSDHVGQMTTITAPATPAAQQWQGFGTALKPAWEPIIVARKPIDGTVAANVLAHGTGGLNIDECRVGVLADDQGGFRNGVYSHKNERRSSYTLRNNGDPYRKDQHPQGRWPANLIHDGSDEVVGLFPHPHGAGHATNGEHCPGTKPSGMPHGDACYGSFQPTASPRKGDSGSAARFFYCAKASKADRDEGCEGEAKPCGLMQDDNYVWPDGQPEVRRRNTHPTVKPTALMRYLCRLVTPPGGLILDPFMGSGSTGKAAALEGFRFEGIELDPEDKGFLDIARARIEHAQAQRAADMPLFQEAAQ